MEVLGVLLAIAIVISGPIAYFMALGHARQLRELKDEVRRLRLEKSMDRIQGEPRAAPRPPAQPPIDLRSVAPPPTPTPTPEATRATPPDAGAPAPALTPAPARSPREPPAPPAEKRDWEQWIGGAVLNRIGIALVVLGITFALGYTFHHLGALGKAAVSTLVSVTLLITGCILERKPNYRYQARGLIAGGWAGLFVTAYAIHALEATRIVDDARLGFSILIAVAGGMIVHSLRYKTQAVTAIAYSLAYSAIVIHSVELYTVAAATLLGLGSLFHFMRRRWFFLAIGGIVATYGSVLLWYMRQEWIDHDQRMIALAAIGINWLVFLAADFSSQDLKTTPAWKPRVVAHLNGACAILLGTLVWALYSRAQLYVPSLVLGAAYVVATIVSHAMKRDVVAGAHTILATLALGYAAWLRFELRDASWIWLAEAEVALLLGLRFNDDRLRRFGVVFFLAPLLGVVIADAGARFRHPHDGGYDPGSLLFTSVAIACFYHAFMQQRRFATSPENTFDRILTTFASWGGFVLVVFSLWIQLPLYALAPADAALALGLFLLASRFEREDLENQSQVAGLLASIAGFYDTMGRNQIVHGINVQIPSIIATALAFFALVVAIGKRRAEGKPRFGLTKLLYAGVATIMLSTMIGQHAQDELIGPYFVAIALVLLEAGILFDEAALRNTAYAFSILATGALGAESIPSTAVYHGIPSRLLTTVPSLAILYSMWWRVRQLPGLARCHGDAFDRFMGRALSYYTLVTLLHLVDASFPLGRDLVPKTLVLLALFIAGTRLRDADLRLQGYALALFLLARSWAPDFESLPDCFGVSGTVAFTFAGVTAFLAAGGFVRAHGKSLVPDRRTLGLESFIAPFGADALFLCAVALAFVYVERTRTGFELSVAFAIEGLVATTGGFLIKSRALRIGGLCVLGIALLLTIQRAFTTFDTIGRIISFLALGGVLLVLSLVYAKIRGSGPGAPGSSPAPDAGSPGSSPAPR